MYYSTVEDIQRLIKWITFSSTSKLTSEDIESMISEADARIDGMIGSIYQTPITNENDKTILTYASTRLAAYEVAKVLIVQAGGELPAVVEGWKTSADNYIAKLQGREIVLENTDRQTKGGAIYSHTAHDPKAPARIWELDKEQW